MANRRKIRDAAELAMHLEKFAQHCEDTGDTPSDYNLAKYLMISDSELYRFYQGEEAGERYKGFPEALKRLRAYREHRLIEQMEQNPKLVTAAIFQLKQPKNGGYTDGNQVGGGGGATVTLKIEGVGGAEAFL